MLDLKRIRMDFDRVKAITQLRGKGDFELDKILKLDDQHRQYILKVEALKSKHNKMTLEVSRLKKMGQEGEFDFHELKILSEEIKQIEISLKESEEKIRSARLEIPNTLREDTPIGKDETDNVVIRKFGNLKNFDFEIKPHWALGKALGVMDFERATKITGTRFTVLSGMAAQLERALINFMIDLHTSSEGYIEISPPLLVNRTSMEGTGQLPKFEDDMFHIPSKDYFLIPTAEVPLTNLYRDEILDESILPICLVANSACFRSEVGASRLDTKGILRQHQFYKVELVKFTHPKHSNEAFESLILSAEEVLKRLELPYRVVRLCTQEVGFSSAITYDIEVWLPSYNAYKEISSCSNFEAYQARRANIRFRDAITKKVDFVHTINGSGLAVGRTLAAIFENYQNEDGSITIPTALIPYMGGKTII